MSDTHEITCIEDVAAYLKSCTLTVQPKTGYITFHPGKYGDASKQVSEYLREHPEHQVRILTQHFLTLSPENLSRLNCQLPEALKVATDTVKNTTGKYRDF